MSAERSDLSCGGEQAPTGRGRSNVALLAETLRNGASRDTAPARGEEKISVFWRLFGGTLLSIAALVVVTVYQQFSGALTELRNDMIRLNEARGELLKKDEFNNRMTSVWNGIKDLQTAQMAFGPLRERTALLEQQLKAAEDERKELTRQLQQLRERMATVEGRQAHAAHEPTAPGAQ